jgi:hypothetical protein
MMPENDWYGHKLVLAWYCGLASPKPIFGAIPHGWGPDLPPSRSMTPRAPMFLWNERHATQARDMKLLSASCIGAPFTYLVRLLWPDGVYPGGRGTIVFPSHSAELYRHHMHVRSFIAGVEEISEPPYTVSIFYQDMADGGVALYRQAGWRVVTFGQRSSPLFLLRTAIEISGHSSVVGDAMQSALLYAGLLERRIRVLGPFPNWPTEFDGWNSNSAPSRWPGLHSDGLAELPARELAAVELGWNSNLLPTDLAGALGWASWGKRLAATSIGRVVDIRYGRGARLGAFN